MSDKYRLKLMHIIGCVKKNYISEIEGYNAILKLIRDSENNKDTITIDV
mgnify:FL=1